jgi:type II secretory pathway pseudopilin PulG
MALLHRILLCQAERSPKKVVSAFTLVELLVTAAIGVLIIAAGAQSIVSHIRSTANQETIRTLRDNWGRINYFLETEISQACSASLSGSNLVLTIPNPTTSNCDPSVEPTVTFSRDASNNLRRNGPNINDDGSLGSGSSDSILSNNVTDFTASLTSTQQPAFTLTLTNGRGASVSNLSSSTRLKTNNRFPLN